MCDRQLVNCDYDSGYCAMAASVPDTSANAERRRRSRGGGSFSSVGSVPINERPGDVCASPEIAPREAGIALTRGQSTERDQLMNEQQQKQKEQVSMTGPDLRG